jgi:hypothetical protein
MSYLKHNISDSESDSESDITTTDDLTSSNTSNSSEYDTDDEIQINYKAFIDLLEQKLKDDLKNSNEDDKIIINQKFKDDLIKLIYIIEKSKINK